MSQEKENSLTSPEDRDTINRWRPEQEAPILSEPEIRLAMVENNNTSYIEKFPRVDRTYADPPPPLQTIGLISFVPAKGAKPNENGVFGFAKLRGNYASLIEANQRAEFIIRNVDSYNQIYHTYVGRPFPITNSSKYSAETDEIDIRKETAMAISQNIKDKKAEEQRNITEIQQREEQLLVSSRDETIDPYDNYITLRVKKAQLSFTFLEHKKKLEEVKDIIIKTREQLVELDIEFPDYKDAYFQKYLEARKSAGLRDEQDHQENFIRFMVEDHNLGF